MEDTRKHYAEEDNSSREGQFVICVLLLVEAKPKSLDNKHSSNPS